VRDVVQQRRGAQDAAFVVGHVMAARGIARRVLVARREQLLAHVQRADRVLETRMRAPG
jgi:hypothetical protein